MFTLEWERRQKRRQRHQAASDLEKTVNGWNTMWKRHHIRAHYVSPWFLPAARLKAGCDEQVRKKTIDSRSLSQPRRNSQLITYHFFIWINFSWNIVCSLFFKNLLGWPWGPALCFLWPAHHHINLLMLALSGKIGFILMINEHRSFNDHYKWKSFCVPVTV